MKKYAFLVYHAQYSEFLSTVRSLGLLHVEEKQEGIAENDQLREKMLLASRIEKSIELATRHLQPTDTLLDTTEDKVNGDALLMIFDEKVKAIESAQQQISSLEREKERMNVWGDYSIEQLESLSKSGVHIKFYSCMQHKYKNEWENDYDAIPISKDGSTVYFVAFNAPFDIDADYITLNPKNSSELYEEILEKQKEVESMQADLREWCRTHINDLRYYSNAIEDIIEWKKVECSTDKAAEEKVMLLEGFCPEESEVALNEALEKLGIYYEINDPKITEVIPIKLKNNAYSRLFEPITKLFSLPNYSELDLTPFLAPFFMLFFGLCLGDGGYGLIILLAATIAKFKIKESYRPFATLFQILGGMTIVVGILTGSFFGIALDAVTWPWLANVKHLFLTEANYGYKLHGYNPMMIFAIVIGLVQIFFGMSLNAAKITKQHGIKYAVSNIAWIVALLGSALIFGLPKLNVEIPHIIMYIGYGIIIIAVLLILFYNSPDSYKSPVKGFVGNIGGALWHTYNMATGLLGDTLSYIRLFALGLTGSILGGVFNNLSIELSAGLPIIVNWIVMLLILLIGHTINFGLCLIGAFVHPLRLTFVEFYKNAGFEGGGSAYKPFKARNKS